MEGRGWFKCMADEEGGGREAGALGPNGAGMESWVEVMLGTGIAWDLWEGARAVCGREEELAGSSLGAESVSMSIESFRSPMLIAQGAFERLVEAIETK